MLRRTLDADRGRLSGPGGADMGVGKEPSTSKRRAGRQARRSEHESLRIWLRLLACHNLIESRLRGRLRNSFETTLPRFDLMAQLERHPEGLKMRDLSRLLMVSGGNVTGLVDRLVEEGFIERRDDPRDRRAYSVHLTAQGKSQFARMAKEHEAWVVDLFAGMEARERDRLHDLLGKLKAQLASLPASI